MVAELVGRCSYGGPADSCCNVVESVAMERGEGVTLERDLLVFFHKLSTVAQPNSSPRHERRVCELAGSWQGPYEGR